MTSTASLQPDPAPIVACTISRDVQDFDLLIEDMEAALGESWGDLGFAEALTFFNQPEANRLEFVALAIDGEDEDNLAIMGEVIAAAAAKGIKVILIAEDVTPAALHQLLRQGADEFVPYPLPEGELMAAIKRLRQPATPKPAAEASKLSEGGDGVILAVQGLAGGVGTSTLAVNLAWELATVAKENAPRVCLLDLDLQRGAAATYLDLPRRDAVFEMLNDTEAMDEEVFAQALVTHEETLQVLTAPADLVPLDIVTPQDIERVLDMAARHFDFVVVDMPGAVVQWTETVLTAAHVYFALVELEMRSAQNTLRLKQALQAEDLPFEKLRFALNRAPRFTDLNGKARVKRMAESLGISIELHLSDGGRQVAQAGDHGTPLARSAPKNPLRRDVAKLAQSLFDLGRDATEAA
ncbi:pilus assembly protein CpaE [Rhodosalinus sediminis]|uniref:Pilus assembly protein CpaE n=1 Tax=Rhodosalinus sediminis TaxID=1940533 RepID=A0A3D9C083_9RHOB|nr:AAA family ATPase [Rhodosalinus sediminis]REC58951.1 pilus assembly protein CpaE [Rhodosalinus sediminis]